MTDDFFRGYSVAEIVLNSALHNFFTDAYGCEVEDVDIVFSKLKIKNLRQNFVYYFRIYLFLLKLLSLKI